MKFEEFVSKLREVNYGIVAMNEYTLDDVFHIYVVVKERGASLSQCVNQTGCNYEKVFDDIIATIQKVEKVLRGKHNDKNKKKRECLGCSGPHL